MEEDGDMSQSEGDGGGGTGGWLPGGKAGSSRQRKSGKRKKEVGTTSGTDSEESGQSVVSVGVGRQVSAGLRNVVVRFGGEGGVKKVEPLKLTKILREKIGEVKYAKVLGDGNLLVGCVNEVQVGRALDLKCVGKLNVTKVIRVGEKRVSGCKGVISGVPLEVSMEKLMDSLKVDRRWGVISAERMKRGVDKVETETILLHFQSETVPGEVSLGFMAYRVREFVPKPRRCYNCQEFGHIASECKGRKRCARCSGEHEYGKCGEGVKPKCCNCGQEHSVAYWGCAVMKKEVEVQQIRVREKVSYAEAIKKAGHREQGKRQEVKVQEPVNTALEEKKKWEEKRTWVAFIAGVLNSVSEVKNKRDRVKMVVKAAVFQLGMKGLTVEEIERELHQGGLLSQEPKCLG